MSVELLCTVIACVSGVCIALIESRKGEPGEGVQAALLDLNTRLVKMEACLNGYPTAREMTEQHAHINADMGALVRRIDRVEIEFDQVRADVVAASDEQPKENSDQEPAEDLPDASAEPDTAEG